LGAITATTSAITGQFDAVKQGAAGTLCCIKWVARFDRCGKRHHGKMDGLAVGIGAVEIANGVSGVADITVDYESGTARSVLTVVEELDVL